MLYTFYPPLLASPWYYLGAFLLIGGSMIWVVLMVVNMTAWKRDNPGRPVPLAMFAITATATAVGVGGVRRRARARRHLAAAVLRLERSDRRRPRPHAVLGDLHAIVYFWLMPAYIAFYTSGGRGGGRAPLQRHDGAAHLHHVPGVLATRRHAPSPRRPGARFGLQVPAILSDLPGRAADACSPCSRSPPAWKSPDVIAAVAGFWGGSERCPGTSRWCWRSACRW